VSLTSKIILLKGLSYIDDNGIQNTHSNIN